IPLEIYYNNTLISILLFFKWVFDFHCFHSIQALRNKQKVGKKKKKKKHSNSIEVTKPSQSKSEGKKKA
ncbi:hypothetical protein TorRG33x02_188330, partial [Trema orientale]